MRHALGPARRVFAALAAALVVLAAVAVRTGGAEPEEAARQAPAAGTVRIIVDEDYGEARKRIATISNTAEALLRGAGCEVLPPDAARFDATLRIRVTGKPLAVYAKGAVTVGKRRPVYSGAEIRGTITLTRGERSHTVEFAARKDPDRHVPFVQTGPVTFITAFDKPEKAPFLEALSESGFLESLAKAIASFWDIDEVKPLVGLLVHGDVYGQMRAPAALARVGKAAVEPLITALAHPSGLVRTRAVEALERLADERAVGPLIETLKDADPDVRAKAAQALGTLGDLDAAAPLLKASKDAHAIVRARALEALGKVQAAEAIGTLLGATLDEQPMVRESAARALAHLGAPALEPLLRALQHRHPLLRAGARRALEHMGQPAAAPLIALLESGELYVRVEAAQALGNIGDPRAIGPLMAALTQEEIPLALVAHRALVRLGKSAVAPLTGMLKSESEPGLSRAARVLVAIGKPAIEPILAAVRDKDWDDDSRIFAANTLLLIGKPAVPALLGAMKDPDPLVRWASAVSLGLMHEHSAVEAITDLARNDPDEKVRRHARNALQMIEKAEKAAP